MLDAGLIVHNMAGIIRKDGAEGVRCPARQKTHFAGIEWSVDCSRCRHGSNIGDPACRKGIFLTLSGKGEASRLALERDFVREYSGDSLKAIVRMTEFCDDLKLHASTFARYGCGKCDAARKAAITGIVDIAPYSPLEAAVQIKAIYRESFSEGAPECGRCRGQYSAFVGDMAVIARKVAGIDYGRLVPYVMPKFSRSRILVEPPEGSVFLRSYEVESSDGLSPILHVSVYALPDSLEKLYFVMPWEYAMDEDDLSLIVDARDRLLRQRPSEDGFLDIQSARACFSRHARDSIVGASLDRKIRLDNRRLERLASALVKYTSGLGVIEDLLDDPHIQDVYVNSPVGVSPLHIVADGEECTSNVYLSESDVESIISRLRAISGRPFSEASPVLDMDLGAFHTRVSVIGNPLTRGLAYAFRRHKKTPWTLPQLVNRRMLSPYSAGVMSLLVDGQSSLLITGSRGAGKTSLLSALMLEIARNYRILAIEDTPELPVEDMQLQGWKVQGIGTRAAVSGSEAEFQASDALRAALRLGESALVLGEVRGPEARSLYEAMRIGASGNSVMGTIHGASCRDVFERVVHDIGVPPASFKATDVVAVCSTVRHGGAVSRERRVIQIAEVVKGKWEDEESVFSDLLLYDAESDALSATDRIDTGRSEAFRAVSRRWGLTLEEVGSAAAARGNVIDMIATAGAGMPEFMEAGNYARCASMFRVICEADRKEHGSIDYEFAVDAWRHWFSRFLKGQT